MRKILIVEDEKDRLYNICWGVTLTNIVQPFSM